MPNKEMVKRKNLKFKHGIDAAGFEELCKSQGNLCLVCKKPLGTKGKYTRESPVIDHDHSKKCCSTVRSCPKCRRGVLHRRCNAGLGMFEDDPVQLRLAAEYLERFQ